MGRKGRERKGHRWSDKAIQSVTNVRGVEKRSGSRAKWMLLSRRKEEVQKSEGDDKERGVNEPYRIPCKSQQWVGNLKIQGIINHLA